MTWIDELRDELRTRQSGESREIQNQTEGAIDEDVAYAGMLVRRLLEELNQELLGGRGSVWEVHSRWGLRLWELWWGRTRTEGQYIVLTLLRDSRGTLYLKVQGRRLALRDPLLERRLQSALQAAFLQPNVYARRPGET